MENSTTKENQKSEEKQKKSYIIPVLAVLLLLAVAWGIYGFTAAKNKSDEVSNLETKIEQLEASAAAKTSDSQNLPADNSAVANKPVQPVAVPKVETIVVFEPGGLFSDAVRLELQTKLVKPYIAYNQDESVKPISMHITTPDTSPGQWAVFVINENGGYFSFLFGNDGTAAQDWWYPECLDGVCTFTDEFKANYPEVVTAAGS